MDLDFNVTKFREMFDSGIVLTHLPATSKVLGLNLYPYIKEET